MNNNDRKTCVFYQNPSPQNSPEPLLSLQSVLHLIMRDHTSPKSERYSIPTDAIDFLFHCCNHLSLYDPENVDTPRVIYGHSTDIDMLIPSQETYTKGLHQFFSMYKNKNKTPTVQEEQLASGAIKEWYQETTSCQLQKMLDYFSGQNQKFREYASVIHVNPNHYITIHVTPKNNATQKYPGTINIHDIFNEENFVEDTYTLCGMWISKFFALYYKEKSKEVYVANDFYPGKMHVYCMEMS